MQKMYESDRSTEGFVRNFNMLLLGNDIFWPLEIEMKNNNIDLNIKTRFKLFKNSQRFFFEISLYFKNGINKINNSFTSQ